MTYPRRLKKYMSLTIEEYRNGVSLAIMIGSQSEMEWLLNSEINSTEMAEFMELLERVENIFCNNHYIRKYLYEKYPIDILSLPPMVLSQKYRSFLLICKILRYKKWNQYYYSQMTDKELSNIIVLQIKKSYIEERKESVERIFV